MWVDCCSSVGRNIAARRKETITCSFRDVNVTIVVKSRLRKSAKIREEKLIDLLAKLLLDQSKAKK